MARSSRRRAPLRHMHVACLIWQVSGAFLSAAGTAAALERKDGTTPWEEEEGGGGGGGGGKEERKEGLSSFLPSFGGGE